MITAIVIDTQPIEGPAWHTLAGWIVGTVLFVLVIFIAVGVVNFVSGKAHANSEKTRKGAMTLGLSVAGAVVMGTAAGAIAWSADNSTYQVANSATQGLDRLMPAGARPAEVTVSRPGALVSCEETVAVEANNAGNWIGSNHPTIPEHNAMSQILESNEVLEDVKDAVHGLDYPDMERDLWDTRWGNTLDSDSGSSSYSHRVSAVEWFPADAGDGCSSSNREIASGTTVTVSVWVGNGETAMAQQGVTEYTVQAP